MKKHKLTGQQIHARHELLRKNPQDYVALMNNVLREYPEEPSEYVARSYGWESLGRVDLALADLDRAISLEPEAVSYLVRGQLLMKLGRYRQAAADFDAGEAIDPQLWSEIWGPLYQADSRARLGDKVGALVAASQLKDDFWSPGIAGSPRGQKAEIIAELQRRAGAAKEAGN